VKNEVPVEHPATANLEECYSRLKEDHKQLIKLKYKDHLSSQEIADFFSKSSDWVRTSLYRLRASLRECLDEFKRVQKS